MAHEVFISYSTKDKPTADAICARLEEQGVRCWYAPRDILPGESWPDSISAAIEASEIVVVVFSASANQSDDVAREIERAAHSKRTIIPIRIEDVEPSKGMDYFLSKPHWLDAISPPLEAHIDRLAEAVKTLLSKRETQRAAAAAPETAAAAAAAAPSPVPVTAPTPAAAPGKATGRRPLIVAGAVLAAIVALGLVFYFAGGAADEAADGDYPGIADGEIVAFVHDGGSFELEGSDRWAEYDADGNFAFSFVEEDRDLDWIYIYDASRGMEIRLPIDGGWCTFRQSEDAGWNDLYHVTPEYEEEE